MDVVDDGELIQIVSELLDVDSSEITTDVLLTDLGADSLDLIELVMALEDRCGVTIPEKDHSKLSTLRELSLYLARQVK